jgi:hypothetical protein
VYNDVPHTAPNEYGTVKMTAQPMLHPAMDEAAAHLRRQARTDIRVITAAARRFLYERIAPIVTAAGWTGHHQAAVEPRCFMGSVGRHDVSVCRVSDAQSGQ